LEKKITLLARRMKIARKKSIERKCITVLFLNIHFYELKLLFIFID